jgi:calmodulin
LEADELEQVMNNVAIDIGVEKPTKEEVLEVLKELGK